MWTVLIALIWLVLVLSSELIGVLIVQQKSLDELFEGWKISEGKIWTLFVLSHLAVPYVIKSLIT